MQYQPFLPEVASGTIDPRAVVVPLRSVLPHVADRRRPRCTAIDHGRGGSRRARPTDGTLALDYDVLVLTAGSWSRVLPVPGLAEHGRGVQDDPGGHLAAQPRAVAPRRSPPRPTTRTVVARALDVRLRGGGLRRRGGAGGAGGPGARRARRPTRRSAATTCAGCWWRRVRRSCPSSPTTWRAYAQRLAHGARHRGARSDTRLDSAEGGVMRLSDGDDVRRRDARVDGRGEAVAAGRAERAPAGRTGPGAGGRRAPRGGGPDDAWAAGDLAAVPDLAMGGFCPPTAQHALREGRRLGRNLVGGAHRSRAPSTRSSGATWAACARSAATRASRTSWV